MNPLRWPIVRHVRYFWHAFTLSILITALRSITGASIDPCECDLDYLDAVWRGDE
jgi:sulfur relay (sulfurtransferase) DsrC/TusE family protein